MARDRTPLPPARTRRSEGRLAGCLSRGRSRRSDAIAEATVTTVAQWRRPPGRLGPSQKIVKCTPHEHSSRRGEAEASGRAWQGNPIEPVPAICPPSDADGMNFSDQRSPGVHLTRIGRGEALEGRVHRRRRSLRISRTAGRAKRRRNGVLDPRLDRPTGQLSMERRCHWPGDAVGTRPGDVWPARRTEWVLERPIGRRGIRIFDRWPVGRAAEAARLRGVGASVTTADASGRRGSRGQRSGRAGP